MFYMYISCRMTPSLEVLIRQVYTRSMLYSSGCFAITHGYLLLPLCSAYELLLPVTPVFVMSIHCTLVGKEWFVTFPGSRH